MVAISTPNMIPALATEAFKKSWNWYMLPSNMTLHSGVRVSKIFVKIYKLNYYISNLFLQSYIATNFFNNRKILVHYTFNKMGGFLWFVMGAGCQTVLVLKILLKAFKQSNILNACIDNLLRSNSKKIPLTKEIQFWDLRTYLQQIPQFHQGDRTMVHGGTYLTWGDC